MPDSDFLAMRSIAAKVWAVLLAIVAIILIATAWMAFAAFNTAHSTADCAMAGLSSNSSVPIELVALAANTMGNYKVAAVLPGFCAALLFIVAAVHILLPKPPNPGCSKCTAGLANTIALTGVIVYISFAIFEGAAHSTWATDQAANYTSACDATTSPDTAATLPCSCLTQLLPDLQALWGPGWFALASILASGLVGGLLRVIAPKGKKADGYGRGDVLLARICLGEAGFFLNLICFPFVLLWHGFDIYIAGCVKVLIWRFVRMVFMPCLGVYKDDDFTGAKALGGAHAGEAIEWIRAEEVRKEVTRRRNEKEAKHVSNRFKLYEGKIEPADLCQGAIGDCWLVAALASAAEQPHSIRNAFLTPEYASHSTGSSTVISHSHPSPRDPTWQVQSSRSIRREAL